MGKGKPRIKYKECIACGICMSACPFSCLELNINNLDKYKKSYPSLVLKEKCTGCGICSNECPLGAIEIARDNQENLL